MSEYTPKRALPSIPGPWLALLLVLSGCPAGPTGPSGATGDNGAPGTACWDLNENGERDPDSEDSNGDGSVDLLDCIGLPGVDGNGLDGEDWTPPEFVGSEICADCHDDQYQRFVRSGHPYKLIHTGAVEPVEPWDGMGLFGEYPSDPPDGYEWTDIEYLIGGWGWKQRYIDVEGYIVTGDEVQYNLESGDWVAYHEEDPEGTKPYDCGACHTSGYKPSGNQGGLPGIAGTWEAPGIHCEECHGRGSHHVAEPYLVPMAIDRSAEQCGSCHYRTDPALLPASDGFIRHHQQWNEMFRSKKHSMDCVDCHDPHQSARYADDTYNPNRSIRIGCESCHFMEETIQSSGIMSALLECTDCHMPYATKSAEGNLTTFSGDLRTHLFAIHPLAEAEPFNQAGDEANPYLTLDYACNSCHGVWASVRTPTELEDSALGYHDPT